MAEKLRSITHVEVTAGQDTLRFHLDDGMVVGALSGFLLNRGAVGLVMQYVEGKPVIDEVVRPASRGIAKFLRTIKLETSGTPRSFLIDLEEG